MTTFRKGQDVYMPCGQKAEYVQKLDDASHLVKPLIMYDSYYGDEVNNEIGTSGHTVVSQVTVDQPTKILADVVAEVEEKKIEAAKLRNDIGELQSEFLAENRKVENLLKDLGRYDGMADLIDLFEGKIKHVVVADRGRVESEPLESFAGRRRLDALHVMFERSGFDNYQARVKTGAYDYGNRQVWLCRDEDEVKAALIVAEEAILDGCWEHLLSRAPAGKVNFYDSDRDRLEMSAEKLGEDNQTVKKCREWLSAHNLAKAEREQEAKRKQLEKLQEELGAA